jgi:thiol-disulfide isomerase/thioredoxin
MIKKLTISCALALLPLSAVIAKEITKPAAKEATAQKTEKKAAKDSYNRVRDFSFYDMQGVTHKFSDYKGKWILVNYWATYCPPCRAEIPDIEEFYRKNKSKFVVLGMDAGGTDDASIKAFKKELDITYPLIPAQESTLIAFGVVMAIPTSYIINPQGEIIDKYVGLITYDDLDFNVNPQNFIKEKHP